MSVRAGPGPGHLVRVVLWVLEVVEARAAAGVQVRRRGQRARVQPLLEAAPGRLSQQLPVFPPRRAPAAAFVEFTVDQVVFSQDSRQLARSIVERWRRSPSPTRPLRIADPHALRPRRRRGRGSSAKKKKRQN
jgi:hypothetical protein